MATPEVRTNQIADAAPADVAASALEDVRLPRWWVLPLIGVVMLVALLLGLLGAHYELAAVVWAGIALFAMAYIATIVAGVHYIRMLILDIVAWRRSANRSQ